jgi:hypothetical protein
MLRGIHKINARVDGAEVHDRVLAGGVLVAD